MGIRSTDHETYQIDSDGVTVWVNNDSGYCIGRFGKNGIDIHALAESSNECLYCTHSPVVKSDWLLFVEKMFEFYGMLGLGEHCPDRFCDV